MLWLFAANKDVYIYVSHEEETVMQRNLSVTNKQIHSLTHKQTLNFIHYQRLFYMFLRLLCPVQAPGL